MDEPLSNLDAKLRVQTRTQIAALQRRLGVTTVYVTHDQVEAMTMGDRVALLKDGLLQQCDTPRNLYDKPANTFVAGFIGSPAMNIFEVDLTEQGACIGNFTLPIPRDARTEPGNQGATRAILGFRPESVEVVGHDQGFPFEVTVVEELGSDAYAYGNLHLGTTADVPHRRAKPSTYASGKAKNTSSTPKPTNASAAPPPPTPTSDEADGGPSEIGRGRPGRSSATTGRPATASRRSFGTPGVRARPRDGETEPPFPSPPGATQPSHQAASLRSDTPVNPARASRSASWKCTSCTAGCGSRCCWWYQ
jgi:hypothetical protein